MKHTNRPVGAALLVAGALLVFGCRGTHVEQLAGAPGRFTIAGDRGAVEIPFELYDGAKPLIRGVMGGKDVAFLIDNGKLFDPVWFYDGEVDSIGVRYQSDRKDSLSGIGEGGASEIREGNDVDIAFGDVLFTGQPSLISPREAGFGAFFPGVNGQVCSLLFKHFVVTFDFDRNVIVLTRPEKFKYRGSGRAIPMRAGANGSYCIPFSLRTADSEARVVMLDIDIGTISPLYLIGSEKNGIRIPAGVPKSLLGYGASGAIHGYRGRVAAVGIGGYSLVDVPAEFVEASANADTAVVESGTFGIPLMKRFNITFDYFRRIMYLEPNRNFGAPFEQEAEPSKNGQAPGCSALSEQPGHLPSGAARLSDEDHLPRCFESR